MTTSSIRIQIACCALGLPWVQAPLHAQDPQRSEALERATRDLAGTQQPGNAAVPQSPPPGAFRLIDVSLDIMGAAGASTERDDVLSDLKGGGHDPKKRGFTLQQAELSLAGAVDPWFEAKAHIVTALDPDNGETIVELEEAFLTTQQLPWDLQLKAGTFLTEFGRANSRHPHQWDWMDQPVINTRLFGGDGMRGPGARVAWLAPTDEYSEFFLGVQNANGETMPSFLANEEVYAERPIGGRLFEEQQVRSLADIVYTARVATAFDLADTTSLGLGTSAAFGPNVTGGDTVMYGVDFVLRWRPLDSRHGYPFVKVEGEWMGRTFDAEAQVDDSDPLNPVAVPGETLRDQGGYLQFLYGFAESWAVGVRGEYAGGSGQLYDASTQTLVGRSSDPLAADRVRVSPMLAFAPSEFSRIRLQYDYDDSDHLGDQAHSIWIGFEVLIGTHPPHSY